MGVGFGSWWVFSLYLKMASGSAALTLVSVRIFCPYPVVLCCECPAPGLGIKLFQVLVQRTSELIFYLSESSSYLSESSSYLSKYNLFVQAFISSCK